MKGSKKCGDTYVKDETKGYQGAASTSKKWLDISKDC